MATGSLNAQGVWIYGEDDSETTFSALLNKLGTSVSTKMKGRIAQSVTVQTTTPVSNSTTTYVSTGLSTSFTPLFSNSRILISVNINGYRKNAGSNAGANFAIFKNNSELIRIGTFTGYLMRDTDSFPPTISGDFSEISGSTTARTYQVRFAIGIDTGVLNVQNQNSASTMTILEITQ